MSNNPSSNRPTEKELNLELKGLLRWKMFALCLPEMEQSDIEEIELNNVGNIENQKLALFGKWLRKCTTASWLDVLSALQTIDEYVLAEQLRVKYCTVFSSLPPSSHSQPPLSTRSDHHSSSTTRSDPSSHSSTRSDPSSRSTTRSDPSSRSTTRSDPSSRSTTRSDPSSRSTTRSDCHSHSPTRSNHTRSSTRSYIQLNSDDVIIQKLEQLHKSFTNLASSIRKRIDELIESGRYSLHDIAIYIEENQICTVRGLTAVKTTDEFFELVRPHYNFLDFHLLETLPDKFLDEEDLQSIRQHKRNVLEFKRNSQVKSLKNNVKELSAISDQHEPVVIEMQDAWGEHPLILVEQLVKHLFMHYSHEVNWFKVVPGSICLMFVARKEVCQSLITSSRQKLEFMRLMGVFSLQIGSEYVLQEDENESYTFEFALLNAPKVGNNEAVRFLLDLGVNVNHSDTEGKTALMLASEAGHEEVVQTLISAGANINHQDNTGETALMIACEKEYLTPNLQRVDGNTAMHTACYIAHSVVVEKLLKGGADANITDENGGTALMFGSKNGHSEVVEKLLKGGADANITDENGGTALMFGSKNGHSEVVEKLLKGGADANITDENGGTALMFGSKNGHSEVVEKLLKGGADANITDENGGTALMFGSKNGHSEVVEKLLKGGADANITDENGGTALMFGSKNGHSEVVEKLLKGGADANITDENGGTALMFASQNGHSEVVQILLKGGADPNIKTKTGNKALTFAVTNGHSRVIELLKTHRV